MTEELLRRQWTDLRAWLDTAEVLSFRDQPTGLGTWSVGDLVAHLGLSLALVADIEAAPEGTTPLSLARYVAAYPPAAEEISTLTHSLAGRLEPDLLAGVDEIAGRAWAALERCRAPIVLGKRGPLTRSDYLTSRLIELVVHADDLAAAIGHPQPAVLPEAREVVADALRRVYVERAGRPPEVGDPDSWIRRATGRLPDLDPQLPLL